MMRAVALLVPAVALAVAGSCKTHREPEPAPALPESAAPAPATPARTPVATVDPCARTFAAGRLDALARNPDVLRRWGQLVVDEASRTATSLPPDGRAGDPAEVAAAWQTDVAGLPAAYVELLRRFDGFDLNGPRNRVEIWGTSLAVELAHERAPPGQRPHLLPIGTDGGDEDLVIDLDDRRGRGRCAVYLADQGSDEVDFVAPDLVAAVDLIVDGHTSMYQVQR